MGYLLYPNVTNASWKRTSSISISMEIPSILNLVQMPSISNAIDLESNSNAIDLESNTNAIYLGSNTNTIDLESNTNALYLDSNTNAIDLKSNTNAIDLESNTNANMLFAEDLIKYIISKYGLKCKTRSSRAEAKDCEKIFDENIGEAVMNVTIKNKYSILECYNRNEDSFTSQSAIEHFGCLVGHICFTEDLSDICFLAYLGMMSYLAMLFHFYGDFDAPLTLIKVLATTLDDNKSRIRRFGGWRILRVLCVVVSNDLDIPSVRIADKIGLIIAELSQLEV